MWRNVLELFHHWKCWASYSASSLSIALLMDIYVASTSDMSEHTHACPVLTLTNSVAMSMGYVYPFRSSFSPDLCPGVGLQGHMVDMYNGLLLRHQKGWNKTICSDMDDHRDCHTEWSKPDRAGEILYDIPYKWSLKRNDSNKVT